MIPHDTGAPIRAFPDEGYTKVFIVCGEGASSRKCLICEQVFSRQESFEHSKLPCQPLASTAD